MTWLTELPATVSRSDRQAAGREARRRLPRRAIGEWQPPADRPSAVELLTAQEETRIRRLVPLRHARMLESPLAFYRGSAVVMASDLGRSTHSNLEVMLCGDAHLSNFGVFGSAEHNIVFDLNDFDEVAPGPFEWDLMRLTTSFLLTARGLGMEPGAGTQAVTDAVGAYQRKLGAAAQRSLMENWYDLLTAEQIIGLAEQSDVNAKQARDTVDRTVAQARRRDSWSAVRKLTEVVDGRRRFISAPPLVVPFDPAKLGVDVNLMFARYLETLTWDRATLLERFEIVDIAHKVVGVGSVGLPALIVLLQGPDPDDILVLQFKAAQASVLEQWTKPAPFDQHGKRVVLGQRAMQASGDPFLGWLHGEARGVHFYGRQLRDYKWSMDVAGLRPKRLQRYAALCGATLASAHARLGDPVMISSYIGQGTKFANEIVSFSHTYADLAEKDYAEFREAVSDGSVSGHSVDPAGGSMTSDDLAQFRMN